MVPTPDEALAVEGEIVAAAVRRWFGAWRPKRHQSLSEWSAQNARLEGGKRYRAFPFQNGIADAFTDPEVEQISVMKSSRIGYSQIVQNYIGYCISQRPTRLLIYQPTIDDAEQFSKDDLEPVLQWAAVREVVTFRPRDPKNQIRAKRFPGGSIRIKGTNSPKEFRRVTADKVILEEPDGYPATAGVEGDPAALAFKRCLTSDDPLKAAGSTPTIDGASRIQALFRAGTQEYRYVPCPHCGHRQRLIFGDGTGPGLRWEPKENPTRVWYRCENGCDIEEDHKAWMDERGEWVAHAPQNGPKHRSFHIWAAYSQFPGAAWLVIAKEFLEVRKDPNLFITFVNQVLGEPWVSRGDAPKWRQIYDRREDYEPGTVPRGGLVLTSGIDVQKDRIEIFVWAWGADRQSWLVDHIVVLGNPYLATTWGGVSEAIQRTWQHEDGAELGLSKVGVDTGFATTQAEAWARKHPGLVIPIKGANSLSAPVFAWSGVRDATPNGRRRKTGLRIGMVGGHLIRLEMYGLLNLDPPTAEQEAEGHSYLPGYIHLSKQAGEEFCKQLVSWEWVESKGEWKKTHAAEAQDGWRYARAVLTAMGADRWSETRWRRLRASIADMASKAPEPAAYPVSEQVAAQVQGAPEAPPKKSRYTPRYPGAGSWFGR
ncbi:terminase gpA endonuclease subunit [Roseomonas mucosa]|uniref:phage terminase large subunit family protein n=1 Tax=Roseomonas mucosa TaxID=207340 RepID=UPI0028CD2368|nr:terminase gpA endonuclease subunit [Roseomonas mucosa]MDT8276710.1 terminase gpA endonuclease subunit [Roseomonas mucosa]